MYLQFTITIDKTKSEGILMIKIHNLSFSYGKKEVIKNISLQFDKGHIYCLVGENGAGKTTLIESILGINGADQERTTFSGKKSSEIRNKLGVVYQENILTPRLKVKEELNGYCELFHATNTWKEYLIQIFELQKILEKVGNSLSGGERRRVLIALAFINQPKYVVLDEPFTGIDTKLRIKFREFISDYVKNNEACVIFSEHNILECKKYDYEFLFMFNKQIIFNGRSDEILRKMELKGKIYNDLQDVYLSLWKE